MYERPILRENHGAFVEVARFTDYRSPLAHASQDLGGHWKPLVPAFARALGMVAGVAPAVIGFATYHPVVGIAVSCCALLVAALVAFGRTVLDGTIELY